MLKHERAISAAVDAFDHCESKSVLDQMRDAIAAFLDVVEDSEAMHAAAAAKLYSLGYSGTGIVGRRAVWQAMSKALAEELKA